MERNELSSGVYSRMEEDNGGAQAESSAEGASIDETTITVDAENGSPDKSAARTEFRRNSFLLVPERETTVNGGRQTSFTMNFDIPLTVQAFWKLSNMKPNVSDATSQIGFESFSSTQPNGIQRGFGFQGFALSHPNVIRRGTRLGPRTGNRSPYVRRIRKK
ncbi:hypothetical protein TNIN_49541 [Trichonephila inaurata madagascariensis]|uniref:Uncharacterized protein n=1 Tax=Trichonephila inaurata madagascariensis TaxID=2747483 RepID=A0A8X6YT24_9ARAC|nr:hypothetical protein TNIN_49541 [Trichonephila inaurata madagascariensis]